MKDLATILDGQSGPEGVRWLLLGRDPRAGLRHAVANLLGREDLPGTCRLRHARFQPGRKFTAYYDVHVPAVGSPVPIARAMAVTWKAKWIGKQSRPFGTARDIDLEAEANRRGLIAPFRALRLDDPKWGMRVELSPLDPGFPQLVRLSDPKYVGGILGKVFSPRSDRSGEVSGSRRCSVMSIRYRPGLRQVLRYRMSNNGDGAVFAKLYADETGARAHRTMKQLADWMQDCHRGVTCLAPLAYIESDRAVLYPHAKGVPLSERLRRGSRDAESLLESTGAALRALHRAPRSCCLFPDSVAAGEFGAENGEGAPPTECISALLPSAAELMSLVMHYARQIHACLPQEPPHFIHGDFKPEHVWAKEGNLTLIDFDLSHAADPALDLGKFLADLHLWYSASRGPELDAAQERFLNGYAPGAPPVRLLRARVYEALELINIPARRLALFDPGWARRTECFVGRALGVLNRLRVRLGIQAVPVSSSGLLEGVRSTGRSESESSSVS